jgi:hypothetical protein
VHVLHSAIDSETSRAALLSATEGRRKIILATNIAESSLTIPGVTSVIDCCRSLALVWNRTLQREEPKIVWVSKSQADQRKGRTGRTCAGTVYRLLPRSQYERLESYETPQMKLQNLREPALLLSCSSSEAVCDPHVVFEACMDPPSRAVVSEGIRYLQLVDALDASEDNKPNAVHPTFLGRLVTSMPVSLDAARLAMLGAREGRLGDAAALCAMLSCSPLPVLAPFGEAEESCSNLKRYFRDAKLANRASVLVANLTAYEFWQRCWRHPLRVRAMKEALATVSGPPAEPPGGRSSAFASRQEEEAWCLAHRLSRAALLNVEATIEGVLQTFFRMRPAALMADIPLPCSAFDTARHACKLVASEAKPGAADCRCRTSMQHDVLFPGGAAAHLLSLADSVLDRTEDEAVAAELMRPVAPATPPSFTALGGGGGGGKKACVFFRRGGCSNAACPFSHSTDAPPAPCRFFDSPAGCSNGSGCMFAHNSATARHAPPPLTRLRSSHLTRISPRAPDLRTYLACPSQDVVLLLDRDLGFCGVDDAIAIKRLTPARVILASSLARDSLSSSQMDSVQLASRNFVSILFGVDEHRLAYNAAIPWSNVTTVILCGANERPQGASPDEVDASRRRLQALLRSLAVNLALDSKAAVEEEANCRLLLCLPRDGHVRVPLDSLAREACLSVVAAWPLAAKAMPGTAGEGGKGESWTVFALQPCGMGEDDLDELDAARGGVRPEE